METIDLKTRPDIARIIQAAFPNYRKHHAFVATFAGRQNINSYWDSGSKDLHAIVEIATLRTKPLPSTSHPYWDIERHGMANQQTTAVESDRVGNIYLTYLPAGYALVTAGTFRGKPAFAYVWLPAAPELPQISLDNRLT